MKGIAIALGLFVTLAGNGPIRAGAPDPGLRAVANASSDIVVAEVLETKPNKAIEGARDTARFKVIRTLKGPLKPGDDVGVYYHLLWVDTEKWVMEKPKFEKGKRYTIFLVKSGVGDGYTLKDQWLAVLPDHPALDKDVAYTLNEVGDLWSDYWRKQHKWSLASQRRIEIVPEAKVIRTKKGLVLSVKIVNHSAQEITSRLSHEWHGGEWPATDLYASATQVQAKQAKSFEPVYLMGEKSDETKLTRIGPGKSVTVELRMDWPGTGSVKGAPLVKSTQSEAYVRVLIVFDAGGNHLEYAASAVKFVKFVEE